VAAVEGSIKTYVPELLFCLYNTEPTGTLLTVIAALLTATGGDEALALRAPDPPVRT